jgi:hypothetical protein
MYLLPDRCTALCASLATRMVGGRVLQRRAETWREQLRCTGCSASKARNYGQRVGVLAVLVQCACADTCTHCIVWLLVNGLA